jgi:predicted nucleic acid-binding protein
MQNIYLDTSIFVNNNFLASKAINSFFQFCQDKEFRLVISKITLNEIKARYRKQAKKGIEKHNELLNNNDNSLRTLFNNLAAKDILKKFPPLNTLCHEFNEKLDHKIIDANALILEYPILDTANIMEDYFAGNAPFNSSNKTHEFPDAIVIAQLEQWCEQNSETCTVFSTDKDFLRCKSNKIKFKKDFGLFVDNEIKRTNPIRTEILNKQFYANTIQFDTVIKEWLEIQLNDESKYIGYTNWLDLHSLDVSEINVLDKDYVIIGVYEECIEISVTLKTHIKVNLNFDDESTGTWDIEDKVMLFRDTIDYIVEIDELLIPITARFFVTDENDFDTEFEIIDINEGKDIDISPESDYY